MQLTKMNKLYNFFHVSFYDSYVSIEMVVVICDNTSQF